MKLKAIFSINMLILITGCTLSYAKHYVVRFEDVACIKPHQGYHYMTCSPITVTINDKEVNIPPNFDTDLASIPRWLWAIIAPSRSDFIAPSILHDYLYACPNGYKRQEADEIFYNALIDNGVSKLGAYEMYLAVRIFGQAYFGDDGSCREQLIEMKARHGKCADSHI